MIASSIPVVFSAGADIKAFTQMDESGGEELINSGHALLRDMGRSRVSTIAAVNSLAFGGGCELAMACNFRIAAESAVFGQPEIKLGIIPGFGGTQRLPRLVGNEKALEMNLIGDAISAGEAEAYGLANRVVPDHELFDTALSWARGSPGRRRSRSSRSSSPPTIPTSTQGIEQEKQGFATAFRSEDAKEGISAFLGKRDAEVAGEVAVRRSQQAPAEQLAAALIRDADSVVALTGRGHLACPPGSPTSARPGTGLWEKVDPMEVAHIDAFHRDTRALLELLPAALRRARRASCPTAPTRCSPSSRRAGCSTAIVTQNIDRLHTQGGLGPGDRGPRLDRDLELHDLPHELPARERRRAVRRGRRRHLRRAAWAR